MPHFIHRDLPEGRILEIRMQSGEVECSLCGEWDDWQWSVPTFNSDVVSNDFPDWMWQSGGGNQPVCRKCYEKHARGEVPTWDHLYVSPGFESGGGI